MPDEEGEGTEADEVTKARGDRLLNRRENTTDFGR